MADTQCDNCPQNAIYTVIIQDLVKARDGGTDPIKFLCMMHTTKTVSAILAVPGRYSIIIDPTGQKQRARSKSTKNRAVVRPDNLEKLEEEMSRFS